MMIYDPGTLSLVLWDGSLQAGSVTIGAVTQSGTWTVDVASSGLPTGAATSAKQDTMIGHLDGVEGYLDGVETSLSSIDTKSTVTASSGEVTLDALEEAVTVAMVGQASCGAYIKAGTFAGTLAFEQSFDGGSTWVAASVILNHTLSSASSAVHTNPNSARRYFFLCTGAVTHFRMRVSAYTSGSCVADIRSGQLFDVFALNLSDGISGTSTPLTTKGIAGFDGSGILRNVINLNAAPSSSDYGQTVRPIFSSVGYGPIEATTPRVAIAEAHPLFIGRAASFRTLGRAGTAGQKILSLHNATGSSVVVRVTQVSVDMWQTVIKAITVAPPIVRLWKVTELPTNGTALTKIKCGGSTTSNASVTVLNDSSSDGTGSGTTLTATLPGGTFVTQQTAPRFITAVGYEMADRMELLEGGYPITLGALEGVVVFLDYTAATQNPVTDMWVASIEWTESAT